MTSQINKSSRPWLPVSISGCRLLNKSWFGDTAYRLLLTDMQSVWEERMDAADIQNRAQELNRRLRAPVQAFFSHLCEVVEPSLSGAAGRAGREAQISLNRQDDGGVSVRLKSELAGLPFYWEFRCTPAPVALVCAQLVRPLLVMSRLLQRQVDQLGGLLVRKDAEIQDYRENGATLSRGDLKFFNLKSSSKLQEEKLRDTTLEVAGGKIAGREKLQDMRGEVAGGEVAGHEMRSCRRRSCRRRSCRTTVFKAHSRQQFLPLLVKTLRLVSPSNRTRAYLSVTYVVI
uniref:Non-homologous end-joining factor 1 n=1 Tax=Stegastes partitus TaxID=144197 RepID=A0A3B5AUS5_9TELE